MLRGLGRHAYRTPVIYPSLDFNFLTGTLSSQITFTRASSATYFDSTGTLQTAGNNVARFDYNPSTLAAQGLLIEEQRTNVLTYSEQFDNAAWVKSNISVTADSTNAPNATLTADTLVRGASASTQSTLRVVTTQAVSTTYTLSIYVKAGTAGAYLYMRNLAVNSTLPNGIAVFNPANGTVVSSSADLTSTITSAGSGWYRCAVTGTTSASIANNLIDVGTCNVASNVTGNVGDSIYVWGAQLEAGAFPTSYIPTTSAAATRSADVASVNTLTPWFNASEGTLYVEWQSAPTLYARYLVSIEQAASSATRIDININSVNVVNPRTVVSGASVATLTGGTYTGGGVAKIAFGYKSADYASSFNSAAVVTATTAGALPSSLATMYLGSITGGTQANGYLRRISYYPVRLANAQLQAITT